MCAVLVYLESSHLHLVDTKIKFQYITEVLQISDEGKHTNIGTRWFHLQTFLESFGLQNCFLFQATFDWQQDLNW